MIRCTHCRSYAIENTGRVLLSYPSYTVYRCLDCGKEFNICNNEEIPHYDFTKSIDVTNILKFDFFKSLLERGDIPIGVKYGNDTYTYFKTLFDNYYYKKDEEFIHLHIGKDLISEADYLYETVCDFYDKIKGL